MLPETRNENTRERLAAVVTLQLATVQRFELIPGPIHGLALKCLLRGPCRFCEFNLKSAADIDSEFRSLTSIITLIIPSLPFPVFRKHLGQWQGPAQERIAGCTGLSRHCCGMQC